MEPIFWSLAFCSKENPVNPTPPRTWTRQATSNPWSVPKPCRQEYVGRRDPGNIPVSGHDGHIRVPGHGYIIALIPQYRNASASASCEHQDVPLFSLFLRIDRRWTLKSFVGIGTALWHAAPAPASPWRPTKGLASSSGTSAPSLYFPPEANSLDSPFFSEWKYTRGRCMKPHLFSIFTKVTSFWLPSLRNLGTMKRLMPLVPSEHLPFWQGEGGWCFLTCHGHVGNELLGALDQIMSFRLQDRSGDDVSYRTGMRLCETHGPGQVPLNMFSQYSSFCSSEPGITIRLAAPVVLPMQRDWFAASWTSAAQ